MLNVQINKENIIYILFQYKLNNKKNKITLHVIILYQVESKNNSYKYKINILIYNKINRLQDSTLLK